MKCHNINDKKQIVKRFEAGMLCQEYQGLIEENTHAVRVNVISCFIL